VVQAVHGAQCGRGHLPRQGPNKVRNAAREQENRSRQLNQRPVPNESRGKKRG
jgi:hypothetical protein